jgi:hypothetical protein
MEGYMNYLSIFYQLQDIIGCVIFSSQLLYSCCFLERWILMALNNLSINHVLTCYLWNWSAESWQQLVIGSSSVACYEIHVHFRHVQMLNFRDWMGGGNVFFPIQVLIFQSWTSRIFR